MINKICPVCSGKNTLYKKDHTLKICYYGRKTKGRKIKILECKKCGFSQELHKNSFDKNYNKDFIEFRNEVTKEMVRDIMKFYVPEYGRYLMQISDIERLLYLEPNYFTNILNGNRKIKPEDATLITIIYNFPFIIKCAAHDFDVNKSVKYIKEFISNLEKSMEINAKKRVNEMLGIEEEDVPISKKE